MKKFFCFFCYFLFFVLFLASCGKQQDEKFEKKVKIVATIFPLYDFARQLTKDSCDVEVKMLTPFEVDVHCFEPKPQDIVDVKDSDLFFYVGGNDVWGGKILKSSQKDEKNVLSAFEIVNNAKNQNLDKKDDHVWTSLRNCVKIVRALKKKLCEVDCKNEAIYEKNAEEYVKQIESLDEKFKNVVEKAKKKLLVFADKFSFSHFAKDYGLNCLTINSGCDVKNDVSSAKISEMIENVKKFKVPLILKSEHGDDSFANVIAQNCNVAIKTMYSCHSCSKEDFDKGETFLSIFKRNLQTLKEALG